MTDLSAFRVRLPRRFGRNLAPAGTLHPVSLRVEERLNGISSADMTLPPEDAVPVLGDFVEVFGLRGSLGLYRVTRTAAEAGGPVRCLMEHALTTLADVRLPGSWAADGTRTAAALVTELLAMQHTARWSLDTAHCAAAFRNAKPKLALTRPTLLQAVTAAAEEAGSWLTVCDTSSSPWRLSFREPDSAPASELRLTRSAGRIRWTLDSAGLCNRLYAVGGTGGSTFTVAEVNGGDPWLTDASADVIGAVDGIYTDGTADTPVLLLHRARKVLAARAQPSLVIEADAAELTQLTGEPSDSFAPSGLCRVTLPEQRIAMTERITAVTHPDLIADPARVTLRLGTGSVCAATNSMTAQGRV